MTCKMSYETFSAGLLDDLFVQFVKFQTLNELFLKQTQEINF